MTKKKDTSHQRLLASARKALAARNVVTPVPAYNARTARIDAAAKRERGVNEPTPEQMAKGHFVEADVNEHVNGRRLKLGRAWQRRPRFETIAELTVPQLFALRRYRRAFDASELSPIKSGLDVGEGGGSGGAWSAISRVEAVAFADVALRRIEASIPGHMLGVLRMVALQDADFKEAALARYGSASGQRRARVKAEFLRAVEELVRGSAPAGTQPTVNVYSGEVPTEPASVDPAFIDERGFMRPLSEIADILRGVESEQTGLASGHDNGHGRH